MGEKNKEITWSTCCVLLSELVSILQLVKPPLIYVLRGHDNNRLRFNVNSPSVVPNIDLSPNQTAHNSP